MGEIKIDRERCKGCELCVHFCPKHCIAIDESYNSRGYRPAVLIRWAGTSGSSATSPVGPGHDVPAQLGTCTGCAICARICPDIAIEVWR